MKKISILIAILCLLVGCAAQDPTTAPPTQPATSGTISPTESTTPTIVPPTSSDPAPTDSDPITFQLYHPDEHWIELTTVEITMDTLDPLVILQHLKDYNVLNEDVALNSAEMDGTQLNLDLNDAFLSQVYACGTTGEAMLMGSLVNTFCSAYGCESMMVTVNGEVIHSGHVDYDQPLYPFN